MAKYQYTGEHEEFSLENPERYSYLYFPLANEGGIMSSISPDLSGDLKINQNAFFMPPVSCENLHNDKSSRNIWCKVNRKTVWSATGKSAAQKADLFTEKKEPARMEAGFMYQKVERVSREAGLKAEITSFVPWMDQKVELTRAVFENQSEEALTIQVVTAIPIYGRSAANIRDHRHVTALLHRIQTVESGVVVNPTMTFDERGHQQNHILYGAFAGNGEEKPLGFYPVMEDFIGEGGNLENPKALYESSLKLEKAGYETAGYEALGGIGFAERTIAPGERAAYVIALEFGNSMEELEELAQHYLNENAFENALEETKKYWRENVNVSYHTASERFDKWMKWVSFQPMLRRIYGCSFLPHHDYGKGGRGWRDLWQDCLALLIMNPKGVRQMLIENFGGVRGDGTNATIIGTGHGEFIADRNDITRVWMDHGIWPFLTTELYIRQTGDIGILLETNTYFKDRQVCRGEEKDELWETQQGKTLKDCRGSEYCGTVLEHILIQHLTSFYDVGSHNHIRLRGADWNDALDLAEEKGESVAFTAMYGGNLNRLAELLEELKKQQVQEVMLEQELLLLLADGESLYDDVAEKRNRLYQYCQSCRHLVSGEKEAVAIDRLIENLRGKAEWTIRHIRETEWIGTEDGYQWYNGYYDNHENRVEGCFDSGVRMMLTGQVFAVMSGTADEEQVDRIIEAADHYLFDPEAGGYRLNTDFKEVKMDLGRMFGFAYGHKENGAVFSHMTTMYANALYGRGKSKEAYKVLNTLFEHCDNFERSKIYPGVPEYIDAKGRGVYHYLTGAASWILVTVITQMYGVKGRMGNLALEPQLLDCQFDKNREAGLSLVFADQSLHVTFKNAEGLDPDAYSVKRVKLNGDLYWQKEADTAGPAEIKRQDLLKLPKNRTHRIEVELA